MMKGMGMSPEEWSTLVTSKDLYCLWISLVFFSDFFFLVWKPCDSFLSNGLYCSQQENFILLEIKLPKIRSRLLV